jgi:serine/threonine-protein kinase RsbW
MHPPVEQQTLARDFVLTGTLAALPPARDTIMEFVRQYCTDEQQEIDIMIALQEALANAILHGCQGDAGKLVHCTVEVSPSAIEFIVRDPGPGFDSAGATDVSEDGTNLTQHGRGIHLMRSLMDEVSYRRSGSELHLKKLRA